jgi:hypothetical protein
MAHYSLQVLYRPPAADRPADMLAEFASHCIESDAATAAFRAINLGTVAPVTPKDGSTVDMPIQFTWMARVNPGPNEIYALCGKFTVPPLGNLLQCGNDVEHPQHSDPVPCVKVNSSLVHEDLDATQMEYEIRVQNHAGDGVTGKYTIKIGHTELCARTSAAGW